MESMKKPMPLPEAKELGTTVLGSSVPVMRRLSARVAAHLEKAIMAVEVLGHALEDATSPEDIAAIDIGGPAYGLVGALYEAGAALVEAGDHLIGPRKATANPNHTVARPVPKKDLN